MSQFLPFFKPPSGDPDKHETNIQDDSRLFLRKESYDREGERPQRQPESVYSQQSQDVGKLKKLSFWSNSAPSADEAADDAADDADEWTERPSPTPMILVMVVLVVVSCLIWFMLKWASGTPDRVPPIILPDTTPFKVRPENPGGMRILHQDKLVYGRLRHDSSQPVEHLLPPPEQPMMHVPPLAPVNEPPGLSSGLPHHYSPPVSHNHQEYYGQGYDQAQPQAVAPAAVPNGMPGHMPGQPHDQPQDHLQGQAPVASPYPQYPRQGQHPSPNQVPNQAPNQMPYQANQSVDPFRDHEGASRAYAPADRRLDTNPPSSSGVPFYGVNPSRPPSPSMEGGEPDSSEPAEMSAISPVEGIRPAAEDANDNSDMQSGFQELDRLIMKESKIPLKPRSKDNSHLPNPKTLRANQFKVQIASLPSRAMAELEMKRLQNIQGAFLENKPWNIQKIDLGSGRGITHRLVIGSFVSRESAIKYCKKLHNRKMSCLVVPPAGQ